MATPNEAAHILISIQTVPGINLSKAKPIARSGKEVVILSQVISLCKRQKIEISIHPEVKEWYNSELDAIQEIAQMKDADDMALDLSYASKLRKYQRVDVNLMLKMRRVILGNDPGTGKTLESIAYADMIKAKRILVICPLSLIGSWADEIATWSEDSETQILPPDGNGKHKRTERINDNIAAGKRWNIANYSILQAGVNKTTNEFKAVAKHPQLFREKWDLIIVDEAHNVRNNTTQVHKGVKLLKSESLILATGTWISKNHYEVFGLLQLLDPITFSSKSRFIETYNVMESDAILRNMNKYSLRPVAPKNKGLYKFMLTQYVIQRFKREVLTELPDVIYKNIPIKMTKKERQMYARLEQDMTTLIGDTLVVNENVISQTIRLRQFALDRRLVEDEGTLPANYVSPKLDAIQNILDITDGPVIIFSTFKSYLNLIKGDLKGRRMAMITGDVPFAERQEVKRKLDAGEINLILGTTKAMSEGLNLQSASTVILLDKTYVPADQNQAISRVDRMGQKQSPVVYSIIMQDTIEEQIEMVNKMRQDMVDEMTSMKLVLQNIREKY